MARIALTGAASNVGRTVLPALEATDHEVTAYTHSRHDHMESELLEITDPREFTTALQGHDVVIHLAAKSLPSDPWERVLPVNIEGTYNCYEAAVDAGLDRVVFASTNHVVQYHNARDPENPGALVDDPRTIRPDDEPRPDSYYAVSKLFGEALGSFYADRHGLEVVNLRIGWLDSEPLRRSIANDPSNDGYARAMYLSERDCQDALVKSVDAAIPRNPLTVNVLSRNQERYLSIVEAMRGLGYEPRDDSNEIFD